MNILAILAFVYTLFSITSQQQCTSSTFERCLCITSTPYCTCSALTSTNTLNFSSSYNSHLVAVASQGCRPCPSNCLRCSSLTVCTLCLSSFELVSGQCQACPVNCQTCSNGVCATCITGYYLDYQTNCQTCPIIGTSVCTISSLQSCLSNYWLDNNAANCISCDANCYQCSSTTKCSLCNQGFYLASNYTCSPCLTQCLTCSDANSCILCANQSSYYNSTLGLCLAGTTSNCLISATNSRCSQCLPGYFLNSSSLCVQVSSSQIISGCQVYASTNGTVSCRNCTVGYFNTTNACYYGCSNLCNSCYGPHYGLCYGCITSAYLLNSHCIPIYNLMQGASYQLFYTAYNNPSFFSGTLRTSGGCLLESMSIANNQLIINLNSLQSYQVTLKWKIYLFTVLNNPRNSSYDVMFNNSMWSKTYSFTADICINNCNGSSSVCIDKGSLDISNIILNTNQLTFIVPNASLGVSQILILASRCGGIQGGACLECSSTSTCTKCVNSNYFIYGYTCVISCPANYYVRTATKTCLSQCVSGTFPDNVQLLCVECQPPCLTCISNISCLTCIQDTYLFQQRCQPRCPDGYFANNMRRTCDVCIRPCLTCLSNLQCLSCIYGFYNNITHSCVLKCSQRFYGNLQTIRCQLCISPCLTCNSNIGTKCRSCINGTYLYSSECLLNCPSGYYENVSTCNLCDITCNTCSYSATNCTSCPIGAYLSNYACIFTCPVRYFADSTINLCDSCPDNCSTCINTLFCQSCISNYVFYALNYSCLNNCPFRYYANAGVCYSCQTPCFQCSSATQCLSCQGQFLFNLTCLSICPSGSFGDTSKMQCTGCNPSQCKECFESASYCTSCFEPLILFNSQCLPNCPQGYYLEQTNYICLSCKQNCLRCISLTVCLKCESNYILQNENCIKSCDAGYYSTFVDESASCVACPSSCLSCRMDNNTLQCISCASGYYNQNTTCLSSCKNGEFGYNGRCFKCIAPCLECLSQSSCISCQQGLGYLFNNGCLNSCPLGYFQSANYSCDRCSKNCLNCINGPTFCISCIKSMHLQGSSCVSACLTGYFSTFSSNVCRKCNYICSTCMNSPTNCTSCTSNLMLVNGNCLRSCRLGSFRLNNTCIKCPESCSICVNNTYCTQCTASYQLTSSFICVTNCPSGFFSSNGICKPCNYPCATCSNYQSCISCLAGYLSSNSCVSSCSSPTYLDNQTLTCELCPQNCSSCINPTQCLQCLQGVLVNGSCLSACPQGYYDYYSICAPCMYGCLSCTDSSTCTECYIGYLYNGVCLQFCPIGWVSPANSSQLVCMQCVPGCLKCTVQANQCTLCDNGLFLYIYTCVSDCPIGTYNNYKTSECVTCQSPCETCRNGYSCDTCIYGYLLYSERSGNQCIQGPSCPNSFYLNVANNTCVQSCPQKSYIDPYRYTCSRPCADTFVLLKPNKTCLQYCPEGMWINSHLVCVQGPAPLTLPYFTCSGLVMRNILVVDCSFNVPIENLMILTVNDFKITHTTPMQIVFINSQNIRIVTNTPVGVFRQTYFTVSLSNRYKLYSMISAAISTTLNDTQRRLAQAYSMPVQNINATFFIQTYFSYTNQQRQTGMQLMQIAQSICIGAFIFWVFSFLKNLKATSLTFVCILQWIYSLSLVDTKFAPNLGMFLEGFKISNFFFGLSPSQQQSIWLIQSSYRETLWGLLNLFDFWTVFLPSIIISCFFGIIYIITLLLHRRFGKNPHLQNYQDVRDLKNPIQSKISSTKSRKMVQVQGQNPNGKITKEDDQYQKEEASIFSNQMSIKSKEHEDKRFPKNVLDADDSANIVIEKSSRSRRSRFSSMKNSQKAISKISIQIGLGKNEKPQAEKPEMSAEQDQQMQRYKLGLKCKIIHDRFYYNYWLHCTLLTASPLSIAVCCQLIAPNPLSLSASIIFTMLTFVLIWIFLKTSLSQQKLFVTTKYWLILYLQTMIQNGMAILSTTQIYIGIMMLMLTINIYVWNRIFSSKRSNQLKHFYQINDALRIVLLLQALIGYTNAKKWDSDTYYYYSWVFIVTLIVLIVFGAVQNTKQFFDREEGAKQQTQKMKQADDGPRSQSDSSIMKSRMLSKHHHEKKHQESQQVSDQIEFFSQHQGQDTDSDNDIIDFDEVGSAVGRKAPKELIRYEKNDYS